MPITGFGRGAVRMDTATEAHYYQLQESAMAA